MIMFFSHFSHGVFLGVFFSFDIYQIYTNASIGHYTKLHKQFKSLFNVFISNFWKSVKPLWAIFLRTIDLEHSSILAAHNQ